MIRATLAVTAGLLFAASAIAEPVTMTDKQLDTVVAGAAPADPGGFGEAASTFAQTYPGAAGDFSSATKGDNGAVRQDFMVLIGSLPTGICPGQATAAVGC